MEIDITKPNEKHDLNLFLEHTTAFEYQNLYLNIKTVFPDGKEVVKLVPVDLADKRGKWNGKCNSKNCKLEVYLQQGFKFKEAGKYIISVEQYSREADLEGINNLRLALLYAENK